MKLIFVFCLISLTFHSSNGYKILGIFPSMAKSHFIVGSSLMKGLAERGHEVTVLIPHALKTPVKNYKQIPLPGIFDATKDVVDNLINLNNLNIFEIFIWIHNMGLTITNSTLHEPNVQQLLQSDEKFDLVILESFINEAMLGFGYHFKAPVIAVSTCATLTWVNEMVGTPSPPSYVPISFLGYTAYMNLPQRLWNMVVVMFERIYTDFIYLPKQEEMYNQFFTDPNKPKMTDLRKNVSLALLNSHFSISYPRPYVPNMIEMGGIHINRNPNPLPKDLQEFMDSASDGVVYFSMGSNLRAEHFSKEKQEAILNTFKSLKQKVLWKWEEKNLQGLHGNILVKDWFPQDSILAHPNMRLFITHGGLLSTTEAIYFGVPVIGIPVFADQFVNMQTAASAGYGLIVHLNEITEQKLKSTINELLNNPKYFQTAKDTSRRYRDQPLSPIDTAAYWVEYVVRHKGAPFLHSPGQDLNFIQYHNIDVLFILASFVFIVYYTIFYIIRKISSFLFGGKTKQRKLTPSKKLN